VLRQMGVDEIYLGKKQKFLTVVSNLESGEPLWFGQERKKETLDEFFEKQLSAFQRSAIRAACVDMWEPFRQSIEQWTSNCRIVYDKFHIMQHAASAVDEVRRAEFFRKGGAAREIVKGKRWLLLSRWVHLNTDKKRQLNELFALNRRVMKAYLLKESLDRLWNINHEGHFAVSEELDRPVALAAAEAYGEAGPDVARSPGGDLELLSNQGADGRGGGGKWKHQSPATKRTWLSRPQLSAAEGTA